MRWLELAAILMPLLLVAASEPAGEREPGHGAATQAEPSAEDALEAEVRKQALKLLEADADAKLAELARLREQLEGGLAPGEVASARDLETLIQFYQAMKPKKAAVLLEKLPAELAAEVLGAMKSRQAGKVLDAMQPAPAVRISKLMAGKRR
jgi:flagellar motility protein MotE (MotC chaperone)